MDETYKLALMLRSALEEAYDDLQSHLATMHDVLFNAVANTAHLIPGLAVTEVDCGYND